MNIPTLIVLAVLILVLGLIVWSEIKKRKNGGTSCSCGCSACAMKDVCHEKK